MPLFTTLGTLLFKLLLLLEFDDDGDDALDALVSVALAALAAATAAALSFIRSRMPGVNVIRGFWLGTK